MHADVMNPAITTVLLIEDDPSIVTRISRMFLDISPTTFHLEHVSTLAAALDHVAHDRNDLILVNADFHGYQQLIEHLDAADTATTSLMLAYSAAGNVVIPLDPLEHHLSWLRRGLCYVVEKKLIRLTLDRSEKYFRAMSDVSPLGIFVSDGEGRCIYTNSAYHRISGLSFIQTLGTNWSIAIHPEDRERVMTEWNNAARAKESFHTEFRFLQKDNSIVWTRINSSTISEESTSFGFIQTVEDITQRKMAELELRSAEEALFAEKERALVTLNSIGDAVLTTDFPGNVTYLNKVAEKMTGWSRQDALGRPLVEVFNVINGITRERIANPAQRAIHDDKTIGLGVDSILVRRDGLELSIEDSAAPIHNRDGAVSGAVIVFHDITESRSMTAKMAHLAQHDFLTDLPNRVLLTERLSQAIKLAYRRSKQVALLFVDIDYFKDINDSLGHSVGDKLLQSVGSRLVSCVRASDTVCRQGGDEFVILLTEIEKRQDAAHIAEKLLLAFNEPHAIGDKLLHITLSIGISVYPDDSPTEDAVMKNADTAMYLAKESGRNNYQFFKADTNRFATHVS